MIEIERLEIADDDSGTDTTVRHMLRLIRQGAHTPDVIATAAAICDRAPGNSVFHQIAALRAWCRERWCFLDDPDPVELLYGADTQLSMIDRLGCMPADCDDAAILFGALGAARGFDVRVICVAFLTPAAPYAHTWSELRPPSERAPWIEGDVTRDMQEIPIGRISRVGVWDHNGFRSGALMARRQLNSCDRLSLPMDVGMFVSPVAEARSSGLGFTIPILGLDTNDIADVANFATTFIGTSAGQSANDKIEAVWRNVRPTDTLSMMAINAREGTGGDHWWYDRTTNQKLTTDEEDFRSSGVFAELIGAHIGGRNDRWYYDDLDLHKLTPEEAATRFHQTFGNASTLEQALSMAQSGAQSGGNLATPVSQVSQTSNGFQPTPGAPFRPGTPPTSYVPGSVPGRATAPPPGYAPAFNLKPWLIGGAAIGAAALAFSIGRKK